MNEILYSVRTDINEINMPTNTWASGTTGDHNQCLITTKSVRTLTNGSVTTLYHEITTSGEYDMNPTTDDKIRCKLNHTLTQMKLQNIFEYRGEGKRRLVQKKVLVPEHIVPKKIKSVKFHTDKQCVIPKLTTQDNLIK